MEIAVRHGETDTKRGMYGEIRHTHGIDTPAHGENHPGDLPGTHPVEDRIRHFPEGGIELPLHPYFFVAIVYTKPNESDSLNWTL